jgi:hypothetical protein
VSLVARFPEPNLASSAVAVWVTGSSFVQQTVVPEATVVVPGEKA